MAGMAPIKSPDISLVIVHGDVTGLPQQPVEQATGPDLSAFATGKKSECPSGLLQQRDEQAGLLVFPPSKAQGGVLRLLQQPLEHSPAPGIPFSGDEHRSADELG